MYVSLLKKLLRKKGRIPQRFKRENLEHVVQLAPLSLSAIYACICHVCNVNTSNIKPNFSFGDLYLLHEKLFSHTKLERSTPISEKYNECVKRVDFKAIGTCKPNASLQK